MQFHGTQQYVSRGSWCATVYKLIFSIFKKLWQSRVNLNDQRKDKISFIIFKKKVKKDSGSCISVKFTSDLQKIMKNVLLKIIPKHMKDKKVNRDSFCQYK